jgi:hypothetical protein
MNKFYLRIPKLLTIVLFVSSIILLSIIKVDANFPSDPGNWSCSPYCCDGKDGNGKPRANTAAGEIDNFDDACSLPSSSQCGGSGRYVGCVGTTCYYPQCIVNPCIQVLEHEKGYRNPPSSCHEYACNPVYKVCKPKDPVCGNNKVETGEDCDPSGISCTDGDQTGSCTSTCQCCVRCSVQCPIPLDDDVPTSIPHPLSEYTFEDIVSCQDGTDCSDPRDHSLDCYEVPSPQPNISLVKHPEEVSTYLGFVSDSHTGGGLYETDALGVIKDNTVNDFFPYSSERYSDSSKLFYMEATFTDGDNPIESTYVWFNKSGTKPTTPMYIDLDNSTIPLRYGTQNKEEFGFLLHHNSGVWTPYIPAISGDGDNTSDLWKKATSANGYSQTVEGKTIISIPTVPGANGIIAKVLIDSVTYSDNGKRVVIRFSLSFKDTETSLLSNRPNEGNYKIWLMGNDTFGFTPYDNYEDKADIVKTAVYNKWISDERIRYYDQWKNTSQSWNLNFDPPSIEKFLLTPSESSSAQLVMEWGFTPDLELPDEFSNIVINLYKSEGLSIDKILISVNNDGEATAIDVNNYFEPEENGKTNDIVGSLIEASNHYLLKISGGSGDGNATLTLNDVGQGLLYFTITVFDKGGNVTSNSSYPLDLRDWLITQGGLLYSDSLDINVNHGDTPPDGWNDKNLLKNISHQNADVSTELVGLKGLGSPMAPFKSENTKSYMIRPYTTPDPVNGYYMNLKGRFDGKKSYLPIKDLDNTDSISGSLSSNYDVGESEIAVLERVGDLTVKNSFVCDRQGVFFVSGNLTIEGKILNEDINKDACIFVVGKAVTIGKGTDFTGTQLEYDQVNAYILSDGVLVIENDNSDSNGIYISGGIHSLSNPGVTFGRSLKVADRLRFPALVVNHHSKYGMLAGRLFGNEITVQQTEVGLKPY